ncbi:MAG TPA: PAS domain S-box protein [Gallionellaceae bacterium]
MSAMNEVLDLAPKRTSGWREPATLTLDERGMICDCSKAGEELFGYTRHELTWQHVSRLLPQLSVVNLVEDGEINPLFGFLCHCGHLFQIQNRHGSTFPGKLSLVHLSHTGKSVLRLIVQPTVNAVA